MLHLPLLRRGEPYKSLDVARAPHHATGQPFVEISQANVGLIRRDLLRQDEMRASLARLRLLLADDPPGDPLAPALADTIRRFGIDRRHLEALLEGMEMDLVKKRYATFEELHGYCYRAASVIGLVCIEIFGHEGGEAPALAEKLAPLITALFAETNPAPLKAALEMMGLCSGELRLPLVPVEENTRHGIRSALAVIGAAKTVR